MADQPINLRKNPLTGSRSIPMKAMNGGANVELPEGTKREFTVVTDPTTRVREQAEASVEKMHVDVRGDKYRMSVDYRAGYVRGQVDMASRLTRERLEEAFVEVDPELTDMPAYRSALIDSVLALMVEGEA